VIVTVEHPDGKRQIAISGERSRESISAMLQREQLALNTRCGGRGLCEGCVIELLQGEAEHLQKPKSRRAENSPLSIRGCQYRVVSDAATIRIPRRSVSFYQAQVVSDFHHCIAPSRDPLLALEKDGGPVIAAAIDVGTTTVVVMLTDLRTGDVLARAADFNGQISFGEDVVTRIQLCFDDPKNLFALQDALVAKTIAPLLAKSLRRASVSPGDLRALAIAGNTTMLHLLAGVDPTSMGVSPFTPTFLEHRVLQSSQLRVDGFEQLETHLLPSAAAYIGADLVAGAVASGLIYDPGPSLLIDVGTNGEILLKRGDKIFACATAAGPAFEGANLTSGMRAGEGAVARVWIDPDNLNVEIEVIGPPDAQAVGICGSGYVDFLHAARKAELLGPTGRFNGRHASHPAFCGRLIPADNDVNFSLSAPGATHPVLISQRDVSRLLQAKAAIAAGVDTLLLQQNLKAQDIRTIYLAGGFGTHLDIPATIACGLLPGFTPDQVKICGNTSLAGAYLALLDRSLLREMKRAAESMQIVELNTDPAFESLYIDHLMLP
jgi:uncharacterized 2Fe-2S/4Fe-4S cluster protein (DUF4445 family)